MVEVVETKEVVEGIELAVVVELMLEEVVVDGYVTECIAPVFG